jgi:hypothetical protein
MKVSDLSRVPSNSLGGFPFKDPPPFLSWGIATFVKLACGSGATGGLFIGWSGAVCCGVSVIGAGEDGPGESVLFRPNVLRGVNAVAVRARSRLSGCRGSAVSQ